FTLGLFNPEPVFKSREVAPNQNPPGPWTPGGTRNNTERDPHFTTGPVGFPALATNQQIGVGDAFTQRFQAVLGGPIAPGTFSVTTLLPTPQTITDDGNGNLIGAILPVEVNTIDYETGTID